MNSERRPAAIREAILERISLAISERIPHSIIVEANVEWSVLFDSYIVTMVTTMLGHRHEPEVVYYHAVPATWWDALKVAIGISWRVRWNRLPQTLQQIHVCPHLACECTEQHMGWILNKPPTNIHKAKP